MLSRNEKRLRLKAKALQVYEELMSQTPQERSDAAKAARLEALEREALRQSEERERERDKRAERKQRRLEKEDRLRELEETNTRGFWVLERQPLPEELLPLDQRPWVDESRAIQWQMEEQRLDEFRATQEQIAAEVRKTEDHKRMTEFEADAEKVRRHIKRIERLLLLCARRRVPAPYGVVVGWRESDNCISDLVDVSELLAEQPASEMLLYWDGTGLGDNKQTRQEQVDKRREQRQ